ncbi:2-dehydropantoate 2-reductase [Pontibacter qinzhouensis]|uniref:2-dehydropantoate 2-reductase n=1 Tax=Pontibacter qinzhouensis TaxID=2603253 RepID=A0A5C8K8J6_9BACT|nr:2-dehydropantoate 2-reductase [Pontibacter qinzhouensis]TXK46085.1 2-dehydropantoate 2-reductase [Pontibacter qinzhouensis]
MTKAKTRIGIAGIGGVGGFVGAPLAAYYAHNPDLEVVFICKGQTLKAIEEKGLIFRSEGQERVVKPDLTSDDPATIGVLDALFLTTKSYALAEVLHTYSDCIGENTLLVPLQNMVHAQEIIRNVLPTKGKVLEGCIYVVSNKVAPGVVEHRGGPGKIVIGGDAAAAGWLVQAVTAAGVDLSFSEHIQQVLWQKFLFLSPVAALTTAYQKNFGELATAEELLEELEQMMLEVKELAATKGVTLTDENIATAKALLQKFPADAKTSLQLDFEQHNRNEKAFLIDYVLHKAAEAGIAVPAYEQVNKRISELYPVLS